MNRQKLNLLYLYFNCLSSVNFHITWLGFFIFYIILDITEGWEQPKHQIPVFNVITIHAQRQTNVGTQTTLLDWVEVGPPKQCVCWCGLNRSDHEAMNNILNIKVHLKTRSGNVNINESLDFCNRS